MKQSITIEVPEGYEAKLNPTNNKIELIKKDTKPKSWKEYCKQYDGKEAYFISGDSTIKLGTIRDSYPFYSRNLIQSTEEAEAFLALMQLRQLRKAWIENWEPDYNKAEEKNMLVVYKNTIKVEQYHFYYSPLSFPTREMAEEFLKCFKDLIEKAKILL